MGGMGRTTIAAVVLLAALLGGAVHAQETCMTIDKDGAVTWVGGGCDCPEDFCTFHCMEAGTGWKCVSAVSPVRTVRDHNENTLGQTIDTIQTNEELVLSLCSSRVGCIAISPTFRIQYDSGELSPMGAIVTDQNGILGADYTFGATGRLFAFGGAQHALVDRIPFSCTGLTLNNTKRYCRLTGGAADATQDDGEVLIGSNCHRIKTISTTWFDNAGTGREASPSCNVELGLSKDNIETSALITVPSGSASYKATPGSATGFADTNEVGLWINGNCSGATRSVAGYLECF